MSVGTYMILITILMISYRVASQVALGKYPSTHRFAYDDNATTSEILGNLKRNARITKDRPGEVSGEPDMVNVSMYISTIRAIRQMDSAITYDLYLRYTWLDERTKYEGGPRYIIVDPQVARSFFWFPDLFFTNAHNTAVQRTSSPNTALKFYREGKVSVSTHLTLVAHCNMDLRYFPHDTQRCGFQIESYMYSSDQVDFDIVSCAVGATVQDPLFRVVDTYQSKRLMQFSSGNYSVASVTFAMERVATHYFVILYVPSFVLVSLSCLVFWLPPAALMERTIYSVFLLFCLVPIMIGSQYGAPIVGYLKAVDIWVISSFSFMAVAVLEVMLLHLIFGRDLLSKTRCGDQFELMREDGSSKEPPLLRIGPLIIRPDMARKVDIALRVLYPAAYVLFNAVYWGIYAT